MRCGSCQRELPGEARYCAFCGAPSGPSVPAGAGGATIEGKPRPLATTMAAAGPTPVTVPALANAGPTTTEYDPRVGTLVAERFRIERRLGAGGMGTVYLAEQVAVKRPVVLKFVHGRLLENPKAVTRFEREALAASQLTCPNTVVLHDYGRTDDGRCYMAMEYIEGRTLAEVIADAGPLSPLRAAAIALQVLASLEEAHDKGMVHRDLKPANVMLVARGGTADFVKVLDFGVVKFVGVAEDTADGEPRRSRASDEALAQAPAGLTVGDAIIGSPQYMAPEQGRAGPVDARADVYALGVMLYEMLCGRPPFDAESTLGMLAKHATAEIPPLASPAGEAAIPAGLERLVRRCLAKLPAERPPDARALAAELRALSPALLAAQEEQERALLRLAGIRRYRPSRRWVAALVGLSLLSLAAAVILGSRAKQVTGVGVLAPGERVFVSAAAARVPPWIERPPDRAVLGVARQVARGLDGARQLARAAALAQLLEVPARFDPNMERAQHARDLQQLADRLAELESPPSLEQQSYWVRFAVGAPAGPPRTEHDAYALVARPAAPVLARLRRHVAELRYRSNDFLLDGLVRRGRCAEARSRAARVRAAIADMALEKGKRALLEHVLSQKLAGCSP